MIFLHKSILLKRITCLAVWAALETAAAAEDFSTLSLEEAVSLALGNNTEFAAKQTALEQARRSAKYAWNALLPSVSLTGGVQHTHVLNGGGESGWDWNAGVGSAASDPVTFSLGAADQWSASIGLNLKPVAAVPVQTRLAAVEKAAAEETYREAERELVTAVSTGFYQLLADKENTGILRDALALAENLYQETRRKYERGLASELDLLNAEYTWRTAVPALADAEQAYRASLARFRLTIGLDGEGEIEPEGEIDGRRLSLPDAGDLAAWGAAARSDVRQAEYAVKTASLSARTTKLSNRVPTVSLLEKFSIIPGSSSKGTFSLSVTIPLDSYIPVSSEALDIRAADENVKKTERALEQTRKTAALDIREKAAAVEQAVEKIESAALNYRITSRAFELSQQGYNAGLVSQTDLDTARQRMVSARQSSLTAEVSHISAVYALAGALGVTVDELYTLYGEAIDGTAQ